VGLQGDETNHIFRGFNMPLPDFVRRLQGRWSYLRSLPVFRAHPVRTLWRALIWRLHCLLKIPGNVWVPEWEARIHLVPEWHGAGVTLFYVARDSYEPELTHLAQFLRPGETFIDAGANCGLFTVAGARIVSSSGQVLAFEPGPSVLPMLERNVAQNNLGNVTVHRCGLGAEPGKVRLYQHAHGASSATLGCAPGSDTPYVEIEIDTLDAILARCGIEKVDTIKMDVEGAEELILRGASALFARNRPRVLFEINPEAIANLKLQLDGAWSSLAARGYRFYSLHEDGQLSPLEKPPSGGGNIIALHPEDGKED
jgi:FkbM family methyltransferase